MQIKAGLQQTDIGFRRYTIQKGMYQKRSSN